MRMTDGYLSKCPKCYTPVEQVQRRYHALGECREHNSGTEHVHWKCPCGHEWMSYTHG